MPSGLSQLGPVVAVFDEFECFSGLELNLPKTVVVPLFHCDAARLEASIAQAFPSWSGIRVAFVAKYLGMLLGPDRKFHAFEKSMHKYLKRARLWAGIGAGLQHTVAAYSVYSLPTV